jgi:hypothetical protein
VTEGRLPGGRGLGFENCHLFCTRRIHSAGEAGFGRPNSRPKAWTQGRPARDGPPTRLMGEPLNRSSRLVGAMGEAVGSTGHTAPRAWSLDLSILDDRSAISGILSTATLGLNLTVVSRVS